MPGDLRQHWEAFRACFTTQTRDPSPQAYDYLRGMLTMEKDRHFAGISRAVQEADGQALQHFMSQSPWSGAAVFNQIQTEIRTQPGLQQGSYLILDESADEKAGSNSAGTSRQYNGHQGKVDECQVGVILGYVNWQAGPWTTWTWVDGGLFLPAEWLTDAFAERRKKLGIPEELAFQTKLEMGVGMIRRARKAQLPFEGVACDELYGRDGQFRADLALLPVQYMAFVPANYRVYLQRPEIGIPQKPVGKTGKAFTRLRVLNGVASVTVKEVAADEHTHWQTLSIRPNERGVLTDRFAARRVWTWQAGQTEPRQEWLTLRIDARGEHTYALSNAPEDTPLPRLAEFICSRYFVERAIEDAKDECGWDEFQAQKYRAYQHHLALTACALWFIAKEKLKWAEECHRDPTLQSELEIEVLPALSTANVCELLRAVLPLPELSLDQARAHIAQHLVNRSRSKAARLRHQAKNHSPT
jgi:SRSO17 transposase